MSRFIRTDYGNGRKVTKRNLASDPNRAILHCVQHMQLNDYGARVAEVYDAENARLYAQVRATPSGKITIEYKYSPGEWVQRGYLKSFRKEVGIAR